MRNLFYDSSPWTDEEMDLLAAESIESIDSKVEAKRESRE